MACFEWVRQPTKWFGDVWAPVAEITLKGADAKAHKIALHIDTGAVITLLRRSVADLLGLDLTTGREITLGSVGGSTTTADAQASRWR